MLQTQEGRDQSGVLHDVEDRLDLAEAEFELLVRRVEGELERPGDLLRGLSVGCGRVGVRVAEPLDEPGGVLACERLGLRAHKDGDVVRYAARARRVRFAFPYSLRRGDTRTRHGGWRSSATRRGASSPRR
jgi:hypothetical protein